MQGQGAGQVREPIRMPWLWVTMVALIVVGSPLLWPVGSVEPLLFGIPSWILVSAAFTVLFSFTVSWACLRCWNVEEPEEEHASGRGTAPGFPSDQGG